MIKIETEIQDDKNDNGYIAINESNEVFYIPAGDSAFLTVMRVLKGKKFNVINLDKVPEDAMSYMEKI